MDCFESMKNAKKCFSVSVLIFVSFAFSIHVIFAANYIPSEQILLNCGESSILNDTDTRSWTPDVGSKFLLSAKSSTSKATTQDPLVPKVPYMTARLSQSEFSYRFPLVPGRKLVRLHFYSNSYNGHNATDALFSVSSGSYTLLRNFNTSQTIYALNYAYIVKEYLIPLDGETLTIKFTPSSNSLNAYAFVNGIEVISMRSDIYKNAGGRLILVGQDSSISNDNTTALENVYRINVGGNDISPSGDTGLFRSWYNDQPYLYGETIGVTVTADPNKTIISYPEDMSTYIAPENVYSTARSMGPNPQINKNYNLTWIFSVDVGFFYMVRLHFCEVKAAITEINQRTFNIFLGNETAESGADVIKWTNFHNGVPVYKDYAVLVGGEGPQQDLWLALHPDLSSQPEYYDAILNGVEIFKLSDTDFNLAGANPIPGPKQDVVDPSKALPSTRVGNSNKQKTIIGGGVGGGLVVFLAIGFCVFAASRHGKDHGLSVEIGLPKTNTTESYASSLLSNLCRHFSFAEIEAATKNFDETLLLGAGGFGKVYRGEIDGGKTKVAIKRGTLSHGQGLHEFRTEIETLSKLRHRHLVSLIGYCEENSEMILVYDYIAHGTLWGHLNKTQNPPLPWKLRLEISIGAARGLYYLHTGGKHTIIHRDVKSTNILLDEKWVAKVSDFGLSKTGPKLDHTEHITTTVKGSFGYFDPDYFRTNKLTNKSDVYSFGVVLLEIICARPALDKALAAEEWNLAYWAIKCHQNGILDQIMDPYLKGKIAPECFKKYMETALNCVSERGIERPSMGDVLSDLEFALQLQESGKMDFQEGSSSTGVLSDHGSKRRLKRSATCQNPEGSHGMDRSGGKTVVDYDTECRTLLDHESKRKFGLKRTTSCQYPTNSVGKPSRTEVQKNGPGWNTEDSFISW